MFDHGLNWKRQEDGTILYRRAPSDPTFVIDERALGQILRFRLLIPLMSFLTLLPAVSLAVFARHGYVSIAVPLVAFLGGAVFSYLYFRSVERKIEATLRRAKRSAEEIQPFKAPRNGRSWETLDDGSVHYWPRAATEPVVLTGVQFAAIGKSNGHVASSLFVSLLVAVLIDGYRWVGDMSNGTAMLALLAIAGFNILLVARLRRQRSAILANVPRAPNRTDIQPPLEATQLIGVVNAVLRRRLGETSGRMLLILICIAVLSFRAANGTLVSLANGKSIYWADLPIPVGPIVPALVWGCSLFAIAWLALVIIGRLRNGREK
ncbi:hypothetical protein ILFOPFJJ_02978 [Ensifer psoraleae]|uniref:hypothetical protein n=1 Tax=Sinorhizobium psoraleae TaxID=520838 RepID=UPI0015697DAE|nr:hypothetical protein [Sinorhizobium psoraleae]NRP72083.1 hypothetical protein [Sinorhizobium psoraleae]